MKRRQKRFRNGKKEISTHFVLVFDDKFKWFLLLQLFNPIFFFYFLLFKENYFQMRLFECSFLIFFLVFVYSYTHVMIGWMPDWIGKHYNKKVFRCAINLSERKEQKKKTKKERVLIWNFDFNFCVSFALLCHGFYGKYTGNEVLFCASWFWTVILIQLESLLLFCLFVFRFLCLNKIYREESL